MAEVHLEVPLSLVFGSGGGGGGGTSVYIYLTQVLQIKHFGLRFSRSVSRHVENGRIWRASHEKYMRKRVSRLHKRSSKDSALPYPSVLFYNV